MFNQFLVASDEETPFIILCIIGGILLIVGYAWVITRMVEVAEEKGHEEKAENLKLMFFLCSITGIGLIIPFIYVLALPDRKLVRSNEKIRLLLEEMKSDGTASIQDESLPEL